MTTKVSRVFHGTQIGKMNSLAQSILQQTDLLGETTSEYLLDLLVRIENKQLILNQLIIKERVKSYSQQNVAEMKIAYQNLLRLIQSYTSITEIPIQPNAEKALAVLLTYEKKILRCTQHLTCNSYVTSLINTLETDEIKNNLITLNYAESLVGKLKAAQEDFIIGHADYHYMRKLQVNNGNASSAKIDLLRLINTELVDYLNTMLRVSSTNYNAFAQAVNSIISGHNAVVKKRQIKVETENVA